MSNVITLDRPYREPPPPEPVAADELATLHRQILEEELRGMQLNNRLTADFMFTRTLRRVLVWGVALFMLAMCSHAKAAEPFVSRSHYGPNGSFAGSTVARDNKANFYDHQGRFSGSAIQYGSSTSYYDGRGRFTGSSTLTGPRR
jgi:hypothetical protein